VAEEFVEGENLERKIAGQPQAPREAAVTVETLARAMHYVHQHGLIHRNLKPSVILLNELGIPKISSFDLACLLNKAPETDELQGTISGTPVYMAPEQIQGRSDQIGPATDVYALGEILYEMLTGQRVFRDDSALNVVMRVLREPPVPPRRLQSKVPAALETICLRCLEKSPSRRYPDAAALADALRGFLG
jgi:serine/threonine protein kinase